MIRPLIRHLIPVLVLLTSCVTLQCRYVLRGPEAGQVLPFARYLQCDREVCRSAVKIPNPTTQADACE